MVLIHKKQFKRDIIRIFFALVVISVGVFCLFQYTNLFRRYIFIDGGAHIGESIANFEKSKLYSKHPWEIFAFEANPNLIPYLADRPNLTVLNKAIWIHDEVVNFYLGKRSTR